MIVVRNLDFQYGTNEFQLRVESLSVSNEERIAVIGPSGCGKTTLLNIIAGIHLPHHGEVILKGETLSQLSKEDRQDFRARYLGLIFQEFELLEYLPAIENVLLPYRISPVLQLTPETKQRAYELLEKVGLSNKSQKYPSFLSQGERQRIAVCRSLVTQPDIILADEPTGNLDPQNRDMVLETLLDYSKAHKATMLVVTHDHQLLPKFTRVISLGEPS